MAKAKLLVVACTAAGKQVDVVNEIRDILDKSDTQYRLITIASPAEMSAVLKRIKLSDYNTAAIYGGDGTIIAALKSFGPKQLPILIIPGGTANVLAKYYGMPESIEDCLKLYMNNTYVIEQVDLASVNDSLLVLDMHMGLWTTAIKSTQRKLKKRVGAAAYAWSALKKASTAKRQTYQFTIDDKPVRTVNGYTFLVANQGNHNILGIPIFPYDHAPGLVQLAIVKSINAYELIAWFTCRLLGKNLNSVMEIYRAKKLVIHKTPKSVLSDDESRTIDTPIEIRAGELSVKIIVAPDTIKSVPRTLLSRLSLLLHFLRQRARSLIYGRPSLRYSHVAPNLYLGGRYSAQSYRLFSNWGITGIVSMRRSRSPAAPASIELLSLPTTDWQPPTLEALTKGVEFIKKHIDEGGAVYVHCKLGEGRGPTMAAAYLITKGFSVDEAIGILSKSRPVVRPNAAQRKRLAEWQQSYSTTITS